MNKGIFLIIFIVLFTKLLFSQWILQYNDPSVSFNSVYFSDELNGWAVGYSGKILHTNNGGTTWEYQNSATEFHLWSVYFINS